MAEQEPENAQWRWPLTIWAFLIILAIEICVISLWKIINLLSRRGPWISQLRAVNISIFALAFIWSSIFLAWAALLSVADDPGLPIVVTVLLTAISCVLMLYIFYRKLLMKRVSQE